MIEENLRERWNTGEENPCCDEEKECVFSKYNDGHCDVCFFCGDHDISEYGDCSKCPAKKYHINGDL